MRVGLPQRGGALVHAARDRGLPTLVSANAFAKYDSDKRFVGFALPKPGAFDGLDVALDSAGFTAMSQYNGYPWSVEAYLDLVASARWAWWASMDLCVEKEIADDRLTRRLRIAGSAAGFGECRRLARLRGLTDPMPVLQGQDVADYLACVDLMPISEWPALVGVGSMCRRNVHGEDGIERVIDALDRVLPPNVRLHTFGVKAAAISRLAAHPRIASSDSCAWDFAARRKRPTGRTQAFRVEEMTAWHARQCAAMSRPHHLQCSLFATEVDLSTDRAAKVIDEWAQLVAEGEIDYMSALGHAQRELYALGAEDEADEVQAEAEYSLAA